MSSDLQQALIAAASSTFEQLGFVFADLELSDEQRAAPVEAVAKVSFRGPMSGIVELRLAGGILQEIACNMLGNFDDLDPETLRDAAGELANVVCGNALPAIGGTEAVFDLGAPSVTLGPDDVTDDDPSGLTEIGLEQGRAEIAIYVTERAAAEV